MDMTSTAVAHATFNQVLPSPTGANFGEAAAADVSRFQDVMQGISSQDTFQQPLLVTFDTNQSFQSGPPLGEKVLNGLSMVSDCQNSIDQGLAEVANGNADVGTILQLQANVSAWSLHCELISKGAGMLSQGVQTMMRNQ